MISNKEGKNKIEEKRIELDKLSKEDKETIENLIIYFNKSAETGNN